jgi:hypothetical protein
LSRIYSVDLPILGRTVSAGDPFKGGLSNRSPPVTAKKPAFKRKESSMTRHIESYRYEILHGDDADFVTYQRKSSDGNWQTISTWMSPDPADY